jgi:hypothetical protein
MGGSVNLTKVNLLFFRLFAKKGSIRRGVGVAAEHIGIVGLYPMARELM